jgi:midasin
VFLQVDQRIEREDDSSETESAKLSPALRQRWQQFRQELEAYAIQVHQAQHSFAFAFVEGSLVHALREGHWVLLDEVNLASPETLECLNGLLDNPDGSVSHICPSWSGTVSSFPWSCSLKSLVLIRLTSFESM